MRAWIWWTRRDALIYLSLVLIAAVTAMSVGGVPWVGSWKMALDWTSGALVLVGPIAAGVAAWHYTRFRKHGLDLSIAQATRGPWPWLHPALVLWGLGMGLHLLVGSVVTTIADTHGSVPAPRELVIVLLAAPVLASQILIGTWIGTRFPGPWAAPVAAIGVFGLGALSSAGLIPSTYRSGGVTGSLVGEGYDIGTIAALGAVALAVAGVFGAATLARVWPVQVRVANLGAVACVLLVLGCELGGVRGPERYVQLDVDLQCAGSQPQVCMAAESSRPLATLAVDLANYAAPLRALGIKLPLRWVQGAWGDEVSDRDGVLRFVDNEEASARVGRSSLVSSLASPALCAEFRTDVPPGDSIEVRDLVTDWISQANGFGAGGRSKAVQAWLATPAAGRWVKVQYEHLMNCELDALERPHGQERK